MAMHNPLGNGRRSRQRGLDGSVPGLPYAHYRRPTTPPLGSPRSKTGGYHQDLYGWGLPREYHPNWNAPAVQIDEYVTDPDWESHQVPHPRQERLLRPFPQREPAEPPFEYEQAKELDAFFLKAMENEYRPHREGEIVPSMADLWMEHVGGEQTGLEKIPEATGPHDPGLLPQDMTVADLPRAEDINDALVQLRQVLPEDHPDIVRLEAAMQMLGYPTQELGMPAEGGVDPGAGIAEDMYRQNLAGPPDAVFGVGDTAVEQPVGLPAFGFGGADEMDLPSGLGLDLEAMLEESMPQAQAGGLEQLIEQEGPYGDSPVTTMERVFLPNTATSDSMGDMATYEEMLPMDQIDMAVDQLMEERSPQEMKPGYEPTPMDQDPFAMAQDVFNQQMQFMANPLMMPGM